MKRLLTSAVLFLCCTATMFAQFTGSGSGTENDPYLILNPIQLNQLRNFLNQSGVYFKLMADIDLTEYLEVESPSQGWQPVGTSSTPFKGVLDGNGKTISGFWIDRSDTDNVGFFGCTNGATIKNLTLNCNSIKGKTYVGTLSAYSTSTNMSGCTLSGSITGESYVGGCIGWGKSNEISSVCSTVEITCNGNYAGGLIGYCEGWDCTIAGNRVDCNSINGGDYIGGICGSYKMDYRCYFHDNYVHTSIFGNDYVGGICGEYLCNSSGEACNCAFVGTIKAHSQVGGIFGYSASNSYASVLTIKSCCAICNIVAGGDNAGGLIGTTNYYKSNPYAYGVSLSDSYSNGTVIGKNNIGGITGYARCGSVTKCYSDMDVMGYKFIGGLFGKIEGYTTSGKLIVNSSVSMSTYLKATEGNVGRIYGAIGNNVTIGEMGTYNENKAYNRTIVISQGVAQDIVDNQQNGTGVSYTTLKLKATYVAMGWDFTDTWAIQETECYPYFPAQTAPPVITSQLVSGATTISGKCVDGGLVTLEIDGITQQMTSTGHEFSFNVSPLQAGHVVRVSAKADDKEQSYYTTEVVSFLGKGTEADPYQVYTAADLTGVYRKGYFKLMNDIDLTSYINQFSPTEGWESIGREGSETIHFDGNGHKITGLWCNSTRDNTGLFSCFANGTIKNLTVVVANGKQVKGGNNTGILIGKMINGTLENCRVLGTVADGTPVGGMVGLFDGGSITSCQASVTINATVETSYVGGLVGEITSGTIDKCFTTGTLTATGTESYVGGLVGKNSSTITNSYSTATVTSSYNAAGLVAYNYGVVDKCYATGDLCSNNYAAGVIGYNDGTNAIIRNCVATNNIINVTYESQQVQQGGGYGQRIIGGIKNGAPAPEMNNYALKTMQVSLNDVPQVVYDDIMNGTAKTAAELAQQSTYETLGWNFTDVWTMDAESNMPQLLAVEPMEPIEDDPINPETGEVEITDISEIDNVIYIEPFEAKPGETGLELSVKMKNTAAIRGFQFDLVLPEGVTLASYRRLNADRCPINPETEEKYHTLQMSQQSDGSYRFLCASLDEATFIGNDGEIIKLKLNIDENIAEGEHPIILKTIKLNETNPYIYYETARVVSKITIMNYVTGDISGDGVVDVSDYIGVANHILGNTPEGFNAQAADVNNDGVIDVSDYIGIANIILTGSIYGNNNAAAPRMEEDEELDPQ